jgi:predicted enzyme related to lactoylglutathione lyase
MKVEVTLDCNDLEVVARFWELALGSSREPAGAEGFLSLAPCESFPMTLTFQQVPEPKTGKNRIHLDLLVADFEAEAQRLERIGASRITREPREGFGQRWFVMADPEGNEFCVAPLPSG